jgi:Flp pilus assembly protein TadG
MLTATFCRTTAARTRFQFKMRQHQFFLYYALFEIIRTTKGAAMKLRTREHSRRGSILVLSAFLMVFMLGMIAFSVDLGMLMLTRTQLQVAADSAAMAAGAVLGVPGQNAVATAQQFAGYYRAAGAAVVLASSDVENGTWDSTARTFTPTGATVSNAVKVTVRTNSTSGGNKLFFGRIFGRNTLDMSASAVALGNPRDICFVVDLSGSMNDDTSTGYGSSASYNSSGYTSTYSSMMQDVYTDFGFGTYPGTTQTIAKQLGSPSWSTLTGTSSPLKNSSFNYGGQSYTIASTYRIKSSDSSSTRTTKAYKWIIDKQLNGTFACMSAAKPTPSSSNTTSYNYWKAYIDDMRSNNGVLGYRSYVTWLMEEGGRDQTVDSNGNYGQLSTLSSNCPYHTESVGGTSFSFPPREQPTHAERRSVIAGLQVIKNRNQSISDTNQTDWVSIVTFDKVSSTTTRLGLTSNYDAAMTSSTTMQAVGNNGYSTATETGLIAAYNLIKPASEGGTGRENTNKIVILLTDGSANLKTSSNSTVSTYRSANPSSDFYGGSGDYESDAALMQANIMRSDKWYVYALALGLDADYDFMDRMARMGGTDDDSGQAPRTSGDPSAYETELTNILTNVITSPQVHLVQ